VNQWLKERYLCWAQQGSRPSSIVLEAGIVMEAGLEMEEEDKVMEEAAVEADQHADK